MKSFCCNVPRRFLLVPVLKEDDFSALSYGGWDTDCTQSVLHAVQRLGDFGSLVVGRAPGSLV